MAYQNCILKSNCLIVNGGTWEWVIVFKVNQVRYPNQTVQQTIEMPVIRDAVVLIMTWL